MKKLSAAEYAAVFARAVGDVPTTQRHHVVERFLQLLRRQRASNLLPRVMTHLQRLDDEAAGVTRVQVATAQALDLVDLAKILSAALGKVVIDTTVQPELVAGVTVQVGDQLIDGSVRQQLQRLHTRLTSTHV